MNKINDITGLHFGRATAGKSHTSWGRRSLVRETEAKLKRKREKKKASEENEGTFFLIIAAHVIVLRNRLSFQSFKCCSPSLSLFLYFFFQTSSRKRQRPLFLSLTSFVPTGAMPTLKSRSAAHILPLRAWLWCGNDTDDSGKGTTAKADCFFFSFFLFCRTTQAGRQAGLG